MKILVVNKFWYLRGGLERVMFDEIAMLEEAGHEVAHFSCRHPDNMPSPYESHFSPYIELGSDANRSVEESLVAVGRMFNNREAARAFAGLLDAVFPDVVHCHGIHRQISPSILEVCRSRSIPVVQTLHDYHHVCPADVLLRGGRVVCLPRRCGKLCYLAAVTNRCVRGSLSASGLSALETGYQRLVRAYERGVDLFICPSRFLAEVMHAGGWRVPSEVLPNPVRAQPREDVPRGAYAVYAGRVSPEKGVGLFLEAARRVGMPAVVAGDGPLREGLEAQYPEAEFRGHVSREEVSELLAGAQAAVMPSCAAENAPMGVLEAMAHGTPIIATRVGGVEEIVDDGVDGMLVAPGRVESLERAMRALEGDPGGRERLATAALAKVRSRFSPECHLERLLAIYDEVRGLGKEGSR